MLMGALLGKKYPLKKYMNVGLIVMGVALFMYSGSGAGKAGTDTAAQVSELSCRLDSDGVVHLVLFVLAKPKKPRRVECLDVNGQFPAAGQGFSAFIRSLLCASAAFTQ